MDYESIKRLGLESYGIDPENSRETYDPSNSNHTIIAHLLKQDDVICPLCGLVYNYTIVNSIQWINTNITNFESIKINT